MGNATNKEGEAPPPPPPPDTAAPTDNPAEPQQASMRGRDNSLALSSEDMRNAEQHNVGAAYGGGSRGEEWHPPRKATPKKKKPAKKAGGAQDQLSMKVREDFEPEFAPTLVAFLRQQGVRNMDVLNVVHIPTLLKEAREVRFSHAQVAALKEWLETNRGGNTRLTVSEFKGERVAEKKRRDEEKAALEIEQNKAWSSIRGQRKEEEAQIVAEMNKTKAKNAKSEKERLERLEQQTEMSRMQTARERSKYMEETKAAREKQQEADRHERAVREAEMTKEIRETNQEALKNREQVCSFITLSPLIIRSAASFLLLFYF